MVEPNALCRWACCRLVGGDFMKKVGRRPYSVRWWGTPSIHGTVPVPSVTQFSVQPDYHLALLLWPPLCRYKGETRTQCSVSWGNGGWGLNRYDTQDYSPTLRKRGSLVYHYQAGRLPGIPLPGPLPGRSTTWLIISTQSYLQLGLAD